MIPNINEQVIAANGASKPGSDIRCCSTQAYNAKTHVCCWPNILPRPKHIATKFVQCCGNTTLDFSKQFCCSDKIYPRAQNGVERGCCYGKVFDKAKDLCCWPNMYPNGLSNKVCCRGKAHDKDPMIYGCCGSKLYTLAKEKCCYKGYNIRKKLYGDNTRCCGSQIYDGKKDSCCDYQQERLCSKTV